MAERTIAAIATADGAGGICVVRLSGPDCGRIADTIFRRGSDKHGLPKPRYLYYGHVTDGQGAVVDEALAVRFCAPHSYTGQDVVEFQCHGGHVQGRRVLDAALSAGAVPAEPGEFTKLAFLSGRIDLSQAEAVMQMIGAKSAQAAALSQSQLDGELSRTVLDLSDRLLDLMAAIGAAADYPQDDVDDTAAKSALHTVQDILDNLRELQRTARAAMQYQDGVRVVLAGRPNAGKSSLLNALLGSSRAIVTDVPGTTRDVLTEPLQLYGIPLTLCDTAGLRASGDVIERIGVERAREQVRTADLVLLVRDVTCPENDEDREVLACGRPLIVVENKMDLVADPVFRDALPDIATVSVSAKTGEGIDQLKAAMHARIVGDSALSQVNLTNQRHLDAVRAARDALDLAREGLLDGVPVDVVLPDIQEAWRQLGLITGQTADEALITRIFSTFCLGK